MFSGTITALITPFHPDDASKLDLKTLESLVNWQLQCGVAGLVVCGTTAETPSLTEEEQDTLIESVVQMVGKRVPVIAGTGTNATTKSIERTKRAAALGADAALAVVPYYNKPKQEGIYQHFRAIAEASSIPLMLYNVPSRTVVGIDISTLQRLSAVKNIVAVKEATDSVNRIYEVCAAVSDKIAVMAGDCGSTALLMSAGGTGVVSATANAIPERIIKITDAGLRGDLIAAHRYQQEANPFIEALFCESNPIPAKTALLIRGKIPSENLRLPLTNVSDALRARLEKLFVTE